MGKQFISKQSRQAGDQKLLSGCEKHLGKDFAMVVDGQKYVARDVEGILQDRLDAGVAVTTNKALWQGSVKVEAAKVAETQRVVSALRQALGVMFGAQPEVLADFGLAPRKDRRARTLLEKAGALEKAQATRKARNTMSRKQREAITAAPSPAVVVVPAAPTAPTPPAPAAPPASPIAVASATPAPAPAPAPATNGAGVVTTQAPVNPAGTPA